MIASNKAEEDDLTSKEGLDVSEGDLTKVEVSLNAVEALAEPRTMKMVGRIFGYPVVVLIDCRATHNFISLELIDGMHLEVSDTRKYGVFIGNGRKLSGFGIYRQIPLHLGKLNIIEDYLQMPVGSVDVILGMKWLLTLRETRDYWKKLTRT